MFQYISDILSKFSKTQRITVLLILIVSLIILTLGPKTISTFSPDSKESQVILKQQDTQIKNLSGQIDSCNIKITQLNKQIIQNQQQCTDNIVKREQEIWKEIDLLETQMKTKSKPVFKMNAEEATYKSINNELKMGSLPETPSPVVNNDNIVLKLENLKKKVVKHQTSQR